MKREVAHNVSAVPIARHALSEARDAARERFCVGKKYPGKPTDYRYVVHETCLVPGKKRAPPKAGATVSIAQTRKEILTVQRILKKTYNNTDPPEDVGIDYKLLLDGFGRMADTGRRLRIPDPEDRFEFLLKNWKERGFTIRPSRYRIFAMLLVHLETIVERYQPRSPQ